MSHLLFADDLLIFIEASVGQMEYILKMLGDFSLAFGHSINREKTSIFFFRNGAPNVVDQILERCSFSLADDLGRYLGALCPNGRGKKQKFIDIIDRIGTTLAGWKAQCLSMAGRVTLAKSMLGSMASLAMQYMKIPLTLCQEMEKI